jgi:hypothetical protein
LPISQLKRHPVQGFASRETPLHKTLLFLRVDLQDLVPRWAVGVGMHRTAEEIFRSAIQENHPLLTVGYHYWIGQGAKKPRKIPVIQLDTDGDICFING